MRFFRPVPRISPAAPEHAAELAAVLLAAWEPHRSQLSDALWEELTPPEAEVAAWLRGGFEVYRVSFESQPVGVVRVAFPTGACVLDRLAVTPEHRRRGFGEYVAEHAVNRARRIERFLSQPFNVAEQFTGTPGEYVPIAESIRGFREILEGKHDDVPERAFLLKGTIDQVVREAGGGEEADEESAEAADEEADRRSEEDSGDE